MINIITNQMMPEAQVSGEGGGGRGGGWVEGV